MKSPEVASDVIQALRHSYDELTQSQKRIAEAIVEDPEFVAFATVDKMASRLGVSPSTVVRFTYRLGLNGYQDLQDRVRQLIRSQIRSAGKDGEERKLTERLGDSPVATSLEHDVDHLRRTIRGLDRESLDVAVDILAGARRLFVCGDATSYSVAYYTMLALERTKGQVDLVRADAESVGRLLDVDGGDALLAFTFPPYATSVLRVVRWVKRRGVRVVGVTDSPISPVGQVVDVVLPTLSSGIGPLNSLVPAMAIANALVNAVIVRTRGRALERYATATAIMEEWDLYVLKSGDGQ